MPINVTDLRAGERVLLNCPKARTQTHRQAIFRGIFRSIGEAMSEEEGLHLMTLDTAAFLETAFASFQFAVSGNTAFLGAFRVEPDGSLRDDDGRRIFIERRLVAGQG